MRLIKFVVLYLILLSACLATTNRTVWEPFYGDSVYLRLDGNPENPPLLLLHGAGDDAGQVWQALIPELQKQFYVITPDLPGFGKSSGANRLYDPAHYSAVLEWLTRELHREPYYVAGHSLGGGLALHFAGTYPQQVQKLVLIDVYGVLHRKVLTTYYGAQREVDRRFFDPRKMLGNVLKSMINRFNENEVSEDINSMLLNPLTRKTALGGNPQRIAGLALVNADLGWAMNRVTANALILWGAEDDIAPMRTADVLRHRLQNARKMELAGCGHTPMYDKPQFVSQEIITFLKQTGAQATEPVTTLPVDGKTIHVNRQHDVNLHGTFDSIIIDGSRNIILDSVWANYIQIGGSTNITLRNCRIGNGLEINGSDVEIDNGLINGELRGLDCNAATLKLTATTIMADTALCSIGSRGDLAGVILKGWRQALAYPANSTQDRPSEFLFSVSDLYSNGTLQRRHGEWVIKKPPVIPPQTEK